MENNQNEFNEDSSNFENVVEDITTNQDVEDVTNAEVAEDTDESIDFEAKYIEEQKKNKQLFARLNKKGQAPAKAVETAPANTEVVTTDMLLKTTQGMNDENIADARMLAARHNITVFDAINHADYGALKEIRQKETDAQSAQLGTSRGKKSFKKPSLTDEGLSRDKHMELWRKAKG